MTPDSTTNTLLLATQLLISLFPVSDASGLACVPPCQHDRLGRPNDCTEGEVTGQRVEEPGRDKRLGDRQNRSCCRLVQSVDVWPKETVDRRQLLRDGRSSRSQGPNCWAPSNWWSPAHSCDPNVTVDSDGSMCVHGGMRVHQLSGAHQVPIRRRFASLNAISYSS
ncbi:unnamed protein product [Protopolystoma xenopodis]|uniref:Secreted protein n=1 Tax=Protopolystoma xenopodis TaxID=117903 RepID=A0A448XPM9_9PLAT|nr:unnamed protein product [Protopolystoma xenopodis]